MIQSTLHVCSPSIMDMYFIFKSNFVTQQRQQYCQVCLQVGARVILTFQVVNWLTNNLAPNELSYHALLLKKPEKPIVLIQP